MTETTTPEPADQAPAKKTGWSLDSLVLIFSIVIMAQVLTYLVPQGEFEREMQTFASGKEHEVLIKDTYTETAANETVTLPAYHFLLAIPRGLATAQNIIFLVFLVGGVIAILRATGAIDALLLNAVRTLGGSPALLIMGCLVLFSLGAFTIGMGEEYVPLIPILVSMSLAMKLDAIVAMGMVWVPYGIGWATASHNPFGVIIAKEIAQSPLEAGNTLRVGMLVVFLLIAFQHVYAYARRIQKDPSRSLVRDVDYSSGFEAPSDVALTPARIAVLLTLLVGIIGFVIGAATSGWYIPELNAIFLGIGLISAAFARMSPNKTSENFIRGASEMTSAALLIGFARTIEVVLKDGKILDSVIQGIASVLKDTGPEITAIGMLGVQTVCNLFIPSGSGQAYVTMPIMAPLAELSNVPKETAVLAYQFGDGFTNMIVPTSALVMGTLFLARIPYGAWFRFCGPLLLKLFAAGIGFLVWSVHMDWTPA